MSSELPPRPQLPPPEALHPVAVSADRSRYRPADVAPEPPPEEELRRYLAAVMRRKWFVIIVTLLGTSAGVLYSRRFQAYSAHATIWVRVGDRRDPRDPLVSNQLLGATGWQDLMKSHAVLDSVAIQERWYLRLKDPEDWPAVSSFHIKAEVHPGSYQLEVDEEGKTFTLTDGAGVTVQRGAVGDSVGPDVGFLWVPPASVLPPKRTVAFSVSTPAQAAEILAQKLIVSTDLDGNFITVELRGKNPRFITATVDDIAQRFVAVSAVLKREKLRELAQILAGQLDHAEARLREAERTLKEFRVRTVTFIGEGTAPTPLTPQSGRDPVFASFFDMKVTLEQSRRDRAAIGRVLAQIPDSGLNVNALELIGAVQRSSALTDALKELAGKQAELRALRYRYTDEHPPVRRLREDLATLERQTIPVLARALITELATREAELARRVQSATTGLREIPAITIEDARLQREVTQADQLVSNIEQKYNEARLAEVTSVPDVRVLDTPEEPNQPIRTLVPIVLLVLAFGGSLGLGVVGAVLRDSADPKVRHPEQVTEAMGLPILGAVPHVSRRNGKTNGDVGPVVEALRGIRLSVLHAHGAGPLLVTVSSPGRSDGKSFVTSNLALAFAETGHRTLLIDGDIRRGALHRALGAGRKPGLTDVLAGHVPPDQVLQTTSYPSLSFIGSGARTHSGPELLSSPAMARFFSGLRSGYDVILVDSAPLAAGVDAFALGTVTGAMLLVLRTNFSNRELAEAKLGVLHRLPIRLLGAVLNDVRLGGEYRYYSYYLAGYEVGDEEEAAGSRRPLLRAPE